jgi:hypothetical protein
MEATHGGPSAASPLRQHVSSHVCGWRHATKTCPRGKRGATLLLASLLILLLTAALVHAAPAKADEPRNSTHEALALLALQQAQLIAPGGASGDFYGFSVSASGDTALIGAPHSNDGRGSAYVFVRSGATWSFQQQLTAADGAVGDEFGFSVSASGDTALVGAPSASVGADQYQGRAYAFVRSGSTWSWQQTLTASDGVAGNEFGSSVALSGDTAVVGAPTASVGADVYQGCAYVFTRSGSTWSPQQKLIALDGADYDQFGSSVALSGDTALVGAPSVLRPVNFWGSAYAFVRSGSSWTLQQKLTAPNVVWGDEFGYSVALSGDTALVGARHLYSEGPRFNDTNEGSAHVFTRSGSTWSWQQTLTAPDGVAGNEFGSSVALSGDTALVGAPFGDTIGETVAPGSAYVFTRSGSTWSPQHKLVALDGADYDRFGFSVALSGDAALVGAPHTISVPGISDPGSAWVFLDSAAPITNPALAPAPNAAGWNKAPVTVTLSASDDLVGVAGTEYRPQGTGGWTPYAAPFVVIAQGGSTFEYRSCDLVGHLESAQSLTVRIDGRRPTTRAYAAAVTKGKRVGLAYKVIDALPGCGKAKATLKIFKGKSLKRTLKGGTRACNVKQRFTWRCTLPEGMYELRVYARDIAGNAQRRVGSARLTVR